MRFSHPDHPGRTVRLGYCMNLHAADDWAGVQRGIDEIAVPLRSRVAPEADFGVGAYLPAAVAAELESTDTFARFMAERGLDAFTFNAFPIGGFHAAGLKQRVFEPTWLEDERLDFTLAVARIAAHNRGPEHLSISTHTGGFGPALSSEEDVERCARNFVQAARALAELEEETGRRIVLSLEPEPRSLCGDTEELARLYERIDRHAGDEPVRRHLGACLDLCHAAVEFEEPRAAFHNATAGGHPLGKVQFSSALRLEDPDDDDAGREALFGLAEPVYLHQTTARSGANLERTLDLPELATRYRSGDPLLRGSDEWRCHFHVPVDLVETGVGSLGTTRELADELLGVVLADPGRWGTEELHLEIETYTWDILPRAAAGAGDRVDGLEREYRHAIACLGRLGWQQP